MEDYTIGEDTLVILYDGSGPDPEITIEEDENGLTILADGESVATLPSLKQDQLGPIELVAS